jgi:hypothetical protein
LILTVEDVDPESGAFHGKDRDGQVYNVGGATRHVHVEVLEPADKPEVPAVIGECGEWTPQVGEWVTGESATDIKGPRVGKYVGPLKRPGVTGITEILDARDGQPNFVLTSTLLPRTNGGAA